MRAAIAGDIERAAQARARPLGVEVTVEFQRVSKAEAPLGNLVVDLMRAAVPGADVAINNGGALRASLPRGPLTYGEFFEMYPFDNAFAKLHIRAGTLAGLIARNLQSEHGFLSVSGLRAKARCKGDALVVELMRPDGGHVSPSTMLTVVASDFLANGGDGLLQNAAPDATELPGDRLVREGMIEALDLRGAPSLDPGNKALFDPARPRVAYTGQRPVTCK